MGICAPYIPVDYGEWQPWVPTLSGITKANGTFGTCRYTMIGNTLIGEMIFTLGSGSVVTGNPAFFSPVALASPTGTNIGQVSLLDAANATYHGHLYAFAPLIAIVALTANVTYVGEVFASPTIPFTWGPGDGFYASFLAEAA